MYFCHCHQFVCGIDVNKMPKEAKQIYKKNVYI